LTSPECDDGGRQISNPQPNLSFLFQAQNCYFEGQNAQTV